MNKDNNFNKQYECSLEHFIQNEYSICREERQYALFLYNILYKYRKPETRTNDNIKKYFMLVEFLKMLKLNKFFMKQLLCEISLNEIGGLF